jgi:hypothetical protein
MSKLRKTVPSDDPTPAPADALYMIRDSVRRRDRLVYGTLDDGVGNHCAIGAFFEDNPKLALPCSLIDEVAAYNDSIPKTASEKTRQREVLKWLNFKLRVLAGLNPFTKKRTVKATAKS